MHGGRLLARALVAHGTRNVFALCGDHINAIFDGCDAEGIRIVDTRHEAAAVHMAEGWSLATGDPGVAVVTGGPGLTNAITPLADAYMAGVPMVLVTGAIRMSERGGGFPQDLDHLALVGPVSVSARASTDPNRLGADLAEAFEQARSRRGPAVLEIPLDVQLAKAEESTPEVLPLVVHGPESSAIAEAARVLGGAERPLAIVGEGAFWSGAANAVRSFAEAARIPVFTIRAARGLLPDDHELCFGPPNFLSGVGQAAFQRADALLVVGTDLDIVLAFGNLAAQAKLVRIDADAERIRRHRAPDVGLAADERTSLEALSETLAGRRNGEAWIKDLREAATDEPPFDGDPVHPARLAVEVGRAAGSPATLTIDAGELALWAYERLPGTGPGRLLTSFTTPLATMGPGIPFAVAAKLARPDEPAVALVGDGAFGFSAMELDTAARHGIDVKVVIGNDSAWGIVKRQMEMGFGRSIAADLADRRYDHLAEALGATGERVERTADLESALKRALAAKGPSVVDVVIDRSPEHPAMRFIAQMFAPSS